MDNYKKTFVINALRRASYRWKGRWTAEKKYKHDGRNQYWCAVCGPEKVYSKKETQMDHIVPIVDPTKGFTTFDEWIDRCFVYEDGWQRLCKEHHAEKTAAEGVVRVETKAKKAKKKATKTNKK